MGAWCRKHQRIDVVASQSITTRGMALRGNNIISKNGQPLIETTFVLFRRILNMVKGYLPNIRVDNVSDL